ncbi:MAG: polysaccharide biosynthesis C-terminal domain-containing protein [Bacteroidales bacterium]|nr:polysaccharide biosynthesis C-terminal domain-containing protein [Bacteroidales bacterium]
MNKQEEKQIKITTQPVSRLVVEYAIPSIVCMLVSNIYNLIDTAFVGSIDTQSTAAIGIVFPYMALVQSFSFYFGHGSGNYISRALGSKKSGDASVMASAGFFSAIIFSVVIAAISGAFLSPVLGLLGSTATILPYAQEYFKYILIGTPFICGTFVLNNQMRHQGNAMFSMYGILSGAVLNIFLDYLLIIYFGMGVAGAGLATAISQAVSFTVMLFLCGRNGGIRIELRKFRMNWNIFKAINAGGLPSLFRQSFMCIAAICLNNLFCCKQGYDVRQCRLAWIRTGIPAGMWL